MRYFVTGGSGFVGQHLIRRLVADGHEVLALARSEASARVVEDAGATPLLGELSKIREVAPELVGCDVVVHSAAYVAHWGPPQLYDEVNIEGTRETLLAAQDAGIPTFVHVSTEAVLADGRPLVKVDETHPRPVWIPGFRLRHGHRLAGDYPRTKSAAELFALGANKPKLRVVAVRPRFVWGPGDTTLAPEMAKAAERGVFRWVGGGHYLTSTCHVANLCEGIILAAEKGIGGQAYFLTDGPDVDAREFVSAYAGAYGADMGDKTIPYLAAKVAAKAVDAAWRTLRIRKAPPVTWTAFALGAHEVTVDDSKARRDLGYREIVTRDQGLLQLQAQ
ncbi:MAG TPA: NAD-dependent epimerase/dehydratase family protein [Nocardioidaceae bacterium]|nr:NAD-dependent epimerase/dehydratase family protein [Nocardioidaceae bacterium]